MNKNNLYLVIEITRLLNRYNCTYKDAEEIIKILTDEIKQQRDEIDLEIEINNNKYKFLNKHISDSKIIKALNHAEPYC